MIGVQTAHVPGYLDVLSCLVSVVVKFLPLVIIVVVIGRKGNALLFSHGVPMLCIYVRWGKEHVRVCMCMMVQV